MNRFIVIATTILALSCAAQTAWSKGAITKIVIDGEDLSAPIEITNPKILDRFTIWSGPGVGGWDMINTIPKPDDSKFIIDWPHGVISDQPEGSRRYMVSMSIAGREAPRDKYEVLYQIDSATSIGYVYLPSQLIDDFGQWNTFQIYRGVEGNWFRSTKEWDEVARPLVEKE